MLVSVMSEFQEVPIDVVQARNTLVDPHTISKAHDPEGRSALAKTITEIRTNSRNIPVTIAQKEAAVEQAGADMAAITTERVVKRREVDARQGNLLVVLKDKLGIGDSVLAKKQAELDALVAQHNGLWDQRKQDQREIEELGQRKTELPDPKELLDAYYEKMQTQPLTNAEKRELLKPEVLENLSMDEYVALWRRLNPYFLTHVTRQGFRDHNGMVSHSSGLKDFHNGFVGVLEDNSKLRPPLGIQGLKSRDDESVKNYLEINGVLDEEDETKAQDFLSKLLNFTLAAAPNYPDKTAVHFMAQKVGDAYYGGESGNEIFFVYPSDVIGSQYDFAFNGGEKDFTRRQSEDKWNDVFVWPNELDDAGISLDAGFVFLPANVPVDPTTGSKYASEVTVVDGQEKRVMVENPHLVRAFVEWGVNQFARSSVKASCDAVLQERNDELQRLKVDEYRKVAVQQFQELGFTAEGAEDLADDLGEYLFARVQPTAPDHFERILKKSGVHWKRAENTVPARQYWEGYFVKNPGLQPKHVYYYEGSPTSAIYEFQQRYNIGRANTRSDDGRLLGFQDKHVENTRTDPRANKGYQELLDTGNKIIAEHFKTPVAVAA